MFSKILLATDGSSHSNHALEVAVDLAKKYDAELTIAHVLTHDHPKEELERMLEVEHLIESPAPEIYNAALNQFLPTHGQRGMLRRGDLEVRAITVIGEQVLKAAANRAEEVGIEKYETKILSGDYANAILELAQHKNTDVIVMGRRGLSTLKGLITGSVSYKISQRAVCTVLTVK